MKLKKLILTLLSLLIFNSTIFAQLYSTKNPINDSQLLYGNHWIYDSLYKLSLESREVAFIDTPPLAVGEIKFYLSQFDYEKLSPSGQDLYEKVYQYLYTQPTTPTRIAIGFSLNPELYGRTNKNIESDITYFYKNYPVNLPIILGISNNVAMGADFFLGKDFPASKNIDSITNIPFGSDQMESDFPKVAYGNIGGYFENWGITAKISKQGLTIGKTQLGSVIYNSTFETEAVSTLTAYSPNFNYNLIFSQVNYHKYLYLHNFNIKLFPNLKISLTEGGLRDGPIEIKYFNPTTLIHQFFPAKVYERDLEEKYDLDNHYCAYFGITLDYYPIKNLRLYGLWSQTENQSKAEINSGKYGKLLPNGYGLQIGADYIHPSVKGGFYTANIEGLWATPFLYVKQSPDWSLISYRFDLNNQSKDVASWIGTPFGPDTIAFTTSFGYQQPQKWSAKVSYLFLMKGELDADTLITVKAKPKDNSEDQTEYPAYYPAVSYYLGNESLEDAIARARDMGLTGIVQYKNTISVSGEYYFTNKIKFTGEGSYIFVFNNNHEKNNFQQGLEVKLSLSYNIF